MALELTPEEIFGITRKKTAAAQLRCLRSMGIRAYRRNDGSVCVLHAWLVQQPRTQEKPRPQLTSERNHASRVQKT